MKVYVDEMPKSCAECPLCRSGGVKINKNGRYVDAKGCVIGQYMKYQRIDDEIDNCPLRSLAEHDRQVRNELLEDMPKILADAIIEIIEPLDQIDFQELEKIARCFESKLDQLRGESDE